MTTPETVVKDISVHGVQRAWGCSSSVELCLKSLHLLRKAPELEMHLVVVDGGNFVRRRQVSDQPSRVGYAFEKIALKLHVGTDRVLVNRVAREREAWLLVRANGDNIRAKVEETLQVVAFQPISSALFPGVIFRLVEAPRFAVRSGFPQERKWLPIGLRSKDILKPGYRCLFAWRRKREVVGKRARRKCLVGGDVAGMRSSSNSR